MKSIITRLLILALIFSSGCASFAGDGIQGLTGTSWRLISYAGLTPLAGKDVTAVFDDSGISGSSSCNHYFGAYQIKGGSITIEGLGWTEMACLDPDGIMEQEQLVMSMLSDAETFKLLGVNLEIRTRNGEILLFEPTTSTN